MAEPQLRCFSHVSPVSMRGRRPHGTGRLLQLHPQRQWEDMLARASSPPVSTWQHRWVRRRQANFLALQDQSVFLYRSSNSQPAATRVPAPRAGPLPDDHCPSSQPLVYPRRAHDERGSGWPRWIRCRFCRQKYPAQVVLFTQGASSGTGPTLVRSQVRPYGFGSSATLRGWRSA